SNAFLPGAGGAQGAIAQSVREEIHFEGLSVSPDERRVIVGGTEAELTVKEFDLLLTLSEYPGRVYSRSQLLSLIWDTEFDGDTTTVTVHIRRLREKLEPIPSEPSWIKTVWGIGYKFEGKRQS
ncbi:response regulator transcription factor, partial [Paenibacillus sepulcri]|nr:response regulator transcription factor [Paenibacillus sepulcri]